MKKIIDGKLYDTETAELVYSLEDTNTHFYKTRKGNYFRYAHGFQYTTGVYKHIITPVSESDVKNEIGICDTDKYIEMFGQPEEA